MIKKLLIIIPVLLIASVIFMPQITASIARNALKTENQSKEWAPDAAYRAATVNMRFFRFKTASAILERAIVAWPDADWMDDACYKRALCYEKLGESAKAIAHYEAFLQKYPGHTWEEQAKKRIVNIKANME